MSNRFVVNLKWFILVIDVLSKILLNCSYPSNNIAYFSCLLVLKCNSKELQYGENINFIVHS